MTHYYLITSNNDDIIITTKTSKSAFIKEWQKSNLKYNSIIELSPGEFLKVIEEHSGFLISI